MAEDFSKPYCGDFVKYTIDEHPWQIAFGAVADFEPGKNQIKVDDDPFDTNKPDKGICGSSGDTILDCLGEFREIRESKERTGTVDYWCQFFFR